MGDGCGELRHKWGHCGIVKIVLAGAHEMPECGVSRIGSRSCQGDT